MNLLKRTIDMETFSTWETLLIGLIALLAIFLFTPGIKATIERGKGVGADWGSVLVPLALVALFVIILIRAS